LFKDVFAFRQVSTHGKTVFRGMNNPNDTLKLSFRQQEKFFGTTEKELEKRKEAGDVFPEFYVLRVNDFDDVATTPLDEWIEFLKTGRISAKAKAAGLPEAGSVCVSILFPRASAVLIIATWNLWNT